MKSEVQGNAYDTDEDRRKFLAACGKFAVVTPPAVTTLLSTSLTSPAIAHSSGSRGNSDRHEHHHDRWGWSDRRDRDWRWKWW
jgi:hypothetical protein